MHVLPFAMEKPCLQATSKSLLMASTNRDGFDKLNLGFEKDLGLRCQAIGLSQVLAS